MHIYQAAEIKQADARAAMDGLSTETLMENAGRSLYEAISGRIKKREKILILSGRGNNGGDGIVLARYLKMNGYDVHLVFPFGEPATETAKRHYRYYQNCGYGVSELTGAYDVIIDSLFGVGFRLPMMENVLKLIRWANDQSAIRYAIDMPTGVLADSGSCGEAFRADVTFCLHGYKPSAFLEGSLEFYGEAEALDIGIPQTSICRVWTGDDVKATLPVRDGDSHKGTFGTGLLIAGSDAMPGSAMLASIGSMRSGIGKLVVATSRFAASIIAGQVPECTYLLDGLHETANGRIPRGVKAAAIGPGLSDIEQIDKALESLTSGEIPVLIDAGALYRRTYLPHQGPIIVTPHPGEFSRMTGIPVKDIQQNRIRYAKAYAAEHQVITVLKGRYTVIAAPDGTCYVNKTGNPAMAKGGSGDILTGMILAFICTHDDVLTAVANAVYIHGACADRWIEGNSAAGMVASDIGTIIPSVMKDIVESE
ncbi:MAG: NAD(P)H-hydrate dehydratase [Bacillus sp. (in: firmicutes)]